MKLKPDTTQGQTSARVCWGFVFSKQSLLVNHKHHNEPIRTHNYNVRLTPSAGKTPTSSKRRKTYSWFRALERPADAKRRKTSKASQARDNQSSYDQFLFFYHELVLQHEDNRKISVLQNFPRCPVTFHQDPRLPKNTTQKPRPALKTGPLKSKIQCITQADIVANILCLSTDGSQ